MPLTDSDCGLSFGNAVELEPFMPGIGNKATSAFCLLYKLFTLKMTEQQVVALLDNEDSVYVRGIGFLWLRYCCPPKELWSWMGHYINDTEPIKPGWSQNSPETTIGSFIRRLLTEQKYYNTIMPRIPVPVARELQKHLDETPLAVERGGDVEMQGNGRGPEDGKEEDRSSARRSNSRHRSGSRRRNSRSRSADRRRDTTKSYRDLDVPSDRKRARSRESDRYRDRESSRSRGGGSRAGDGDVRYQDIRDDRDRDGRRSDRRERSSSRTRSRNESRSGSSRRRSRSRSRSRDRGAGSRTRYRDDERRDRRDDGRSERSRGSRSRGRDRDRDRR
ncbi:hypothetical protein, variant [Sphaeroforma arctica JP610]|uniref:Pre-mRNA-splicing factor 38 n=1 Tax=Sphaeroforma arctica JP610 TaxID=667725 RepID=A0A0L0GCU8_9EUKA|nr:hypothetical protein, variant [Sphaeroforma arctica JP610]KNC86058.1 hypothetical protein, variant [Sphaeroforma arctica JP610]|eukprot:XP_014159960.1 hypothetical protein, variant [Sphaeroforma arctica JP610]